MSEDDGGGPLGLMSAHTAMKEVMQRHSNFWNCTRRFAIQQRKKAFGSIRSRAIGDHTESCNNLAAARKQNTPMASVSTVMNMTANVARHISDRGDSDTAPSWQHTA